MPGIPQNTSYNQAAGQAMQGVINQIYTLGKGMAKRKAVDTSRYNGLANQVSSTANQTSMSTPANLSNLGKVSVPYGGSTKYEGFHPGVDIANKIGTPVGAFASGTVVEEKTGQAQGSPGFGNYIIIKDAQGNMYRYSHLNRALVKVGQPVTKGMAIGEMGNTGQTYSLSGGTGSHLDLRIKDIYGKYINPYSLIS